MYNIPGGLKPQDEPASDFDVITVLCEKGDCMTEVLISTDELCIEFVDTGGVSCDDCRAVNL